MRLGECAVACDVSVLAIDLPPDDRARMLKLGLYAGAVVRVTHRGPFGGRVVAVGGTRLALDGSTAAAITVAPR
jgi:ferrous iron transport protein A